MKGFLKYIISRLVRNDSFWRVSSKNLARLTWFLEFQRKLYEGREENTIIERAIDDCMPDLTVRYGPFAGMRYAEKTSLGSALFPKLLGSYEREIHSVIESVCRNEYDNIIDIGCAEGYYAVGMALRIPSAKIFAFDLNEKALELCKKTAELNGVAGRVSLSKECSPQILAKLASSGSTLVICDCDSCEKGLFTEDIIPALSHCDLIIETHDCYDMTITGILRSRFAETHTLQVIDSLADIKKVYGYEYTELAGYDLNTRKLLLSERPHHQEWFYLTPKE